MTEHEAWLHIADKFDSTEECRMTANGLCFAARCLYLEDDDIDAMTFDRMGLRIDGYGRREKIKTIWFWPVTPEFRATRARVARLFAEECLTEMNNDV